MRYTVPRTEVVQDSFQPSSFQVVVAAHLQSKPVTRHLGHSIPERDLKQILVAWYATGSILVGNQDTGTCRSATTYCMMTGVFELLMPPPPHPL